MGAAVVSLPTVSEFERNIVDTRTPPSLKLVDPFVSITAVTVRARCWSR